VTKTHYRPFRTAGTSIADWLSRPLSNYWCALGWIFATAIFAGVTAIAGGLTENDANVSVYVAWSLAHGHLSCGYLPSGALGYAPTAPLYPLLSGGIAALLRIGHSVAFPTEAQLGLHCLTSTSAINEWALRSGAWAPTLRIGFVAWIALTLGVIAILRTSGRGRSGWEPATLIILACVPPIAMCLVEYFHPQDLLALGLALLSLAAARRNNWVWSGIFLGLALVSQQFALLIFAPLLLLVPSQLRFKFVGVAVLSGAAVAVPVILLTSGQAFSSVVVGTGESSASNSWLVQTGIHGTLLFALSRFLPIAFAIALSWWAYQRLGQKLFDPVPFLSLTATCVAFRLVFEINVWGYYFMATAVLLVVLDIICGRIRITLVAWLIAVTVVVIHVFKMRTTYQTWPATFWQVVLVASATALALIPLLSSVRANRIDPRPPAILHETLGPHGGATLNE
jgi:hypothetical protein